MSANFYDNSALMGGVDLHAYIAIGPPPAFSTPIPIYPYFVGAPLAWPTATSWKRTATVRSEGWKMLQRGFELYLVPHVPIPGPPPGAGQIPNMARIILFSSSKARMAVHSVTGEGTPLATCLAFFFGKNMNCSDPFALPVGNVVCFNSVKTSPTLGDYVGAAAGAFVDACLGAFFSGFMKGLGEKFVTEAIIKMLFRRRSDLLKLLGLEGISDVADPASLVQKVIQQLIDGADT